MRNQKSGELVEKTNIMAQNNGQKSEVIIKTRARLYYFLNKEKRSLYYFSNREKRKIYDAEYYIQNKDKIKKRKVGKNRRGEQKYLLFYKRLTDTDLRLQLSKKFKIKPDTVTKDFIESYRKEYIIKQIMKLKIMNKKERQKSALTQLMKIDNISHDAEKGVIDQMLKSKHKKVVIGVRLSEFDYLQLKSKVSGMGITVSEYLRKKIRRDINNGDKNNKQIL